MTRFIGATPASSDGRSLLLGLCQQVTRLYSDDETTLPQEYKDLVQEFPRRLALAQQDKPLVLFLDALDQLANTNNARSLGWLPRELPPHVKVVVSTLPGECLKNLESKLPLENRLELRPMPVAEGDAILDVWLKEAGRTLQPGQMERILAGFQECGLPLFLKLAFEEARHWKSYDPAPTLSPDIQGMIRGLFAHLSADFNHGAVLVSCSLAYLAAAKNGLSEDELLDVLSMDKEVLADFYRRSPKSPRVDRLPPVIWSRLYYDLEPYLAERSADGTSLLSFYHAQVREVIAQQLLQEKEKYHHLLVEYFNNQPLAYTLGGMEKPNLRKLSELPYQQSNAGEGWA